MRVGEGSQGRHFVELMRLEIGLEVLDVKTSAFHHLAEGVWIWSWWRNPHYGFYFASCRYHVWAALSGALFISDL